MTSTTRDQPLLSRSHKTNIGLQCQVTVSESTTTVQKLDVWRGSNSPKRVTCTGHFTRKCPVVSTTNLALRDRKAHCRFDCRVNIETGLASRSGARLMQRSCSESRKVPEGTTVCLSVNRSRIQGIVRRSQHHPLPMMVNIRFGCSRRMR